MTTTTPTEPTDAVSLAYRALVEGQPLRVRINGKDQEVRPHPLAETFNVMTEQAFAALCLDVKDHGFREPVTLTDLGEVLDGRHRCAAAMATDTRLPKPRTFKGSDAEARALIGSLNLHHREQNKAQRALSVRQLFLPAAQAEATARMKAGGEADSQGRASEIAARMSGGLVSARSVDALAVVDRAPRTAQAIREGRLTTVAAAVRAAQEELGEAPAKSAASKPDARRFSVVAQSAQTDLRTYVTRLESGSVKRLDVEAQRKRIEEWRDLLVRAEDALDALQEKGANA